MIVPDRWQSDRTMSRQDPANSNSDPAKLDELKSRVEGLERAESALVQVNAELVAQANDADVKKLQRRLRGRVEEIDKLEHELLAYRIRSGEAKPL